ncbi:MAG: hypothetical protein NZ602_17375, partial [Thermoguttaceae bacterium]|nr:hypothetical protein [Thermoguttaceae bacterium]
MRITRLRRLLQVLTIQCTSVNSQYRSTEANLRIQLTRYILRAGLKPWPKLWVAMRQSRAIELAREYPAHVATAWCGHSK